MKGELEDMLNLGPNSAAMLRGIGINKPDDLMHGDLKEIYKKYCETYGENKVMLYAMVGAIENIRWQDVRKNGIYREYEED